jgi:hypothetical protein
MSVIPALLSTATLFFYSSLIILDAAQILRNLLSCCVVYSDMM